MSDRVRRDRSKSLGLPDTFNPRACFEDKAPVAQSISKQVYMLSIRIVRDHLDVRSVAMPFNAKYFDILVHVGSADNNPREAIVRFEFKSPGGEGMYKDVAVKPGGSNLVRFNSLIAANTVATMIAPIGSVNIAATIVCYK